MQVRDAASSAKKFRERAKAAQSDYQAGVQGAGPRWKAGAAASVEAHREGTEAALREGRFERGIAKAGVEQKYQNNAVKLGPARFAQGVENAEPAYQAGVQPFISAMQSTTLSPRGARAGGNNIRRVQEQIDLMRRVKRETLGITG